MTASILLFDIETSPLVGYTWGTWNTNVIEVTQDWYMLTWAAKWHGQKRVMCDSLHYHESFDKDITDDYDICKSLWDLLNEADIVVAHNGNKFDIKKANARFIYHGFEPPSPFKTVDTLSIARQHCKFTSNKLDDLGEHLGVGRKIKTDWSLWKSCMEGDTKAFDKMVKYNKQDVKLLEKVYDKLKPWTPRHPNLAVYAESARPMCSTCGSIEVIKDGKYHTNSQIYQKWRCKKCGACVRSRGKEGSVNEFKTIAADRR